MSVENLVKDKVEQALTDGCWIEVNLGMSKYFGKVPGCEDKEDFVGKHLTTYEDSGVRVESNIFHMSPVFECYTPLSPGPGGQGVNKPTLILPVGMTLNVCKMLFNTSCIGSYMFLEDLHKSDQDGYKKLVEAVVAMQLEMRARESGITLAGNSRPPKGGFSPNLIPGGRG